jgi:hypothetical protein
MNEEQAALDFFSRKENLPLALITAEHIDTIRLQLNNEFWHELRKRLDAWLASQALPWNTALTEDRNNEDCVVGLHLKPNTEYRVFLRPFMEQQFLGDSYRIFYGLMWSALPDIAQKAQPEVESLRSGLNDAGLKHSDSFLAWQWLPWHPRRRDFLQRFVARCDELMDEALQPWQFLLIEYGDRLATANTALNEAPRNAVISLARLHKNKER